jgi:hypothetical protein
MTGVGTLKTDGNETVDCAGLSYTGAMTIFNVRKFQIENSVLMNNQTEDALNVYKSNVEAKSIRIEGSASDAFDCDYCVFKGNNLLLRNNLGDGLDISGTLAFVENSNMDHQSDKNISVGENSRAFVVHSVLNESHYGVAAKDSSFLSLNDVTIQHNEIGIGTYVKKAYYLPPQVEVGGKNKIADNGENEKFEGYKPVK